MQPCNQTTPVKKTNFEFLYNELLNEKRQLLQEIQEYRNLEPIFEANKEACDNAYKGCEQFMQVLLVRYDKVVRSEAEEKERGRRCSLEKNELKEMINSLTGDVLEKDEQVQSLRSTNQLLQNRLKEVEENGYKLRVELDTEEERIESLNRQKKEVQEELSYTKLELETLEKETINRFQHKYETFEGFMHKVARLHSDVNEILVRCNISADMIVRPVRTSDDDQIEAMKKSIKQLGEIASHAINGIVKQKSLDELESEKNKLRDELESSFGILRSLKAQNRYNQVRQKELEGNVNKYAENEQTKSTHMQQLKQRNSDLKYESERYQDQVKMLEKEKHRLQEESDKASIEFRAAMLSLTNDPQVLCERNLSLQQKLQEFEKRVMDANNVIIFHERLVDTIKTTLRTNILAINGCDPLTTLLNELENPGQLNWNSSEHTTL